MKNKIIGDCLEIMPTIEQKFDMILTDPPYNIGFNYANNQSDRRSDYRDWCLRWVNLCINKLKDNGIIAIINYPENNNLLFSDILDRHNIHFLQQLIWTYNVNFGISNKRYTKSYRTILILSKGKKYTFNPIKQPYKNPEDKRIKRLIADGSLGTNHYDVFHIELCKNISKDKKNIGKNQLPSALIDMLISTYTNEGDWILDPFVGNGTVIDRADELNRNAIGIDIIDYGRCT